MMVQHLRHQPSNVCGYWFQWIYEKKDFNPGRQYKVDYTQLLNFLKFYSILHGVRTAFYFSEISLVAFHLLLLEKEDREDGDHFLLVPVLHYLINEKNNV